MGRPIRVARSKQFVKLQANVEQGEDVPVLISDGEEHSVAADEPESNLFNLNEYF